MKKIVAATLVAFGLLASTQASFAGNFKHAAAGTQATKGATTQSSHGAQGLLLGTFETDCDFFTSGKASGDFQTILVNQHNQATVHLKANGGAVAYCDLENTLSTPVTIKTPISFNLVKGNGNYLGVEVLFIPQGSTSESFIDFATPDSKLFNLFDGVVPLIDNGNGFFTIPLAQNGLNGIPQGARLTGLFFAQFANPKSCDNKSSNVNHLTVNNRGVGLDMTSPAAFCDDNCGCEGGGEK